jgi:hypothetical protein
MIIMIFSFVGVSAYGAGTICGMGLAAMKTCDSGKAAHLLVTARGRGR